MTKTTSAPRGLERVTDNSANKGAQETGYRIKSGYATSIFQNDPVIPLNTGGIGIGVAGSAVCGVFNSVKYIDSAGEYVVSPRWPASTATQGSADAEAMIIEGINDLFSIQETDASGGAGTPLDLSSIGLNANFLVGSGSTSLNISTTSLNNASVATTSTLNVKIVDLDRTKDETVGQYSNWLVSFNNHVRKGGTGTTGI